VHGKIIMSAVIIAVVIGLAVLGLTVWIELRERPE